MFKHKETIMNKLGRMLVLLLGLGATSSMLPLEAYALRPCRMSNSGTNPPIVYGPPPEDLHSRLPSNGLNGLDSDRCPGPPFNDPDMKKFRNGSVQMNTKSRSHTK